MQIYSEIGQLKKVLLHKPGKELEHLIPKELERLLFDDIPYLKTAREEHDAFADTLRSQGVEVVYLCDLMAETLRAEPELKEQFIRQLILEGGSKPRNFENELTAYLMSIREEKALVYKTMAGVSAAELGVRNRQPLAELVQREKDQVLRYELIGETGPDHDKVFRVQVLLNGEVVGTGEGRSKKEAEQMAAKAALELLEKA